MAKRYHDSASGMISDNKSARANLPQEVIMKDYSSEGLALPENYPGYGPSVIEAQLGADSAKINALEQEIINHKKPAEDINRDLESYLGHREIQLATADGETGYAIMRGDKPAHARS